MCERDSYFSPVSNRQTFLCQSLSSQDVGALLKFVFGSGRVVSRGRLVRVCKVCLSVVWQLGEDV